MATPWTITVDCADARLLAEFWSAALGYAPAPPPTGFETWEAWMIHHEVPCRILDVLFGITTSAVRRQEA